MNSNPELAVTSCITICNSRITCMICVPPYSSGNIDYNKNKLCKSDENLSEFQFNIDDEFSTSNTNNDKNSNMYSARSRFLIQQLSEHLSPNLEPESLLDYDSLDDGETDSQSGSEQQASPPSVGLRPNSIKNNNIPLLGVNKFLDIKHSTMWIGNEDGR